MALDASGHINTAKLQKELSAALHADDKRKKVDEMKKRAIHTASSYDEFRHMVSCAELKPVSRKEMESLGHERRGWTKPGAKPRTSTSQRKAGTSSRQHQQQLGADGPLRAPQTQSEFERDWRRRCKTDQDKLALLGLVGASGMAQLFKVELEPALLGQLLCLLCRCVETGQPLPPREPCRHSTRGSTRAASSSQVPQCSNGEAESSSDSGSAGGGVGSSANNVSLGVAWLEGVSQTGRFSLNVHFLGGEERAAVKRMVEVLLGLTAVNQQAESLHALLKLYGAER